MDNLHTFVEILEAADRLSVEEQAALIAIMQRRLRKLRRLEIATDIEAARREFQSGRCKPATVDEIMQEILT